MASIIGVTDPEQVWISEVLTALSSFAAACFRSVAQKVLMLESWEASIFKRSLAMVVLISVNVSFLTIHVYFCKCDSIANISGWLLLWCSYTHKDKWYQFQQWTEHMQFARRLCPLSTGTDV